MREHVIMPVLNRRYPVATHGKGVYLYDTEGRSYLDGSSGAVTASIGHGVPEIMNAMKEQAEKVSFVYRTQFTNLPAEQLGEKLAELAPGDLNWSFFVNSGSEATEAALKIAVQYWQEKGKPTKTKILSRWMSYHGITNGALSMSGFIKRREPFTALLEEYPSVSAPYSYRCDCGKELSECGRHFADELEKEIIRLGKDNIAAFIAEPIIGSSAGAVVPPEGYYERIKEICEKHEILFIADEVMTGIGRTGKMFAMEHWGVTPDLLTLGKGMSAGYTPMAAAIVSDHVMEPILNGSGVIIGGHTYSGNPQSAAVSLAVLSYIEKHNIVEKSAASGAYVKERLEELKEKFPFIGDVRGKGLMLGVEFVADRETKAYFPAEFDVTNLIDQKAMENGLLVYPSAAGTDGLAGSAVMIAPPLTITREEVEDLLARFEKTLEDVESILISKGWEDAASERRVEHEIG